MKNKLLERYFIYFKHRSSLLHTNIMRLILVIILFGLLFGGIKCLPGNYTSTIVEASHGNLTNINSKYSEYSTENSTTVTYISAGETNSEKPDLSEFDDLQIMLLEANSNGTITFTNSRYIRIFFESYEEGSFSILINSTEIAENVHFYSGTLETAFNQNITYDVIIQSNSDFDQHIIYAVVNSTEYIYNPLVLSNESNTFEYLIEKVSSVNIDVKSYNNEPFTASIIKKNDTTNYDILEGNCSNVTECVQSHINLDKEYQYVLIIKDSYNETPNQIEYAVYYDDNSDSTSSTTIILAIILSVLIAAIFLFLAIVVFILIRKKIRNRVTTI